MSVVVKILIIKGTINTRKYCPISKGFYKVTKQLKKSTFSHSADLNNSQKVYLCPALMCNIPLTPVCYT